jgi:hypothetical protein
MMCARSACHGVRYVLRPRAVARHCKNSLSRRDCIIIIYVIIIVSQLQYAA